MTFHAYPEDDCGNLNACNEDEALLETWPQELRGGLGDDWLDGGYGDASQLGRAADPSVDGCRFLRPLALVDPRNKRLDRAGALLGDVGLGPLQDLAIIEPAAT